ncbi:MAG: hypothetical protein HY287_14105 [Planctomycetes bacterium]|nr:hypothetical protein [Planctomycetota bacterium]
MLRYAQPDGQQYPHRWTALKHPFSSFARRSDRYTCAMHSAWDIILRIAVSGSAVTVFLKCVADGVGRAQQSIQQLEQHEHEKVAKRRKVEGDSGGVLTAEPA